jgi:fatty-acyl-CoA synthase
MNISLLLQMASDGMGPRAAVGRLSAPMTFEDLAVRAGRAAGLFASLPGQRVGLVDLNSEAVMITLYGSAIAGRPFVPINYRLTDEQLRRIAQRISPAVIIVGKGVTDRIGPIEGITFITRTELLAHVTNPASTVLEDVGGDPTAVAALLFTSGTTGEPKAAVLRHQNLNSYVFSTVEYAGAGEDEAALVSVPPYHIAGISAALTSVYGGRRVVYVEAFDPGEWVAIVRSEAITHAMVVPTMLARILDVLEAETEGDSGSRARSGETGSRLPSLRSLSYGGGPMPIAVIKRALRLMPRVDFVNAYGLTETSSTVALLGPAEHREAAASMDAAVRDRLGSVGRPLPAVTVSIRDADGRPVGIGVSGEIWVSGEQVSGEYLDRAGSPADAGGWFATRDEGHLDADGFLYVHGRLDDVIVRGGENLLPGEIESTLVEHPAVNSAVVVGVPDVQWGQKILAAVILEAGAELETDRLESELRDFVKARLRSTKTPERIQFRTNFPYNETGKLLRRDLSEELAAAYPS